MCDEVDEGATGLTGRTDFEVGRNAGYVVTDEDESAAEVLKLAEPLEVLLALEFASLDSFDCFTAWADGASCLLDFELKSGMSGMDSIGGNWALGGRGGGVAVLRESDVATEGAGS
jgi:hypothetical protein